MGSTILNVDDHEINRYIRTQILKQAGYRVVEAATGEEAISKWASEKPSLVLLDVNLPDMLGVEVCRRIKANSAIRTLVVHVSATFVDTSDQASGLQGGADGYLCEPVDAELLLATVGSFLRLREAETRLQDSQERLAQAQTIAGLTFWEWDIARHRVLEPGEDHGNPREIEFEEWLAGVDSEDRAAIRQILEEACAGKRDFDYEFRDGGGEGPPRWLATKGRVFYDARGKAVRAIGTNMEITGRKRIELALKRSNEDLSQFAFMIGHDLQEPLRTITTMSELLALKHAGSLSDDARSCLSLIVDGGRRMSAMITELLAFCHVQDDAAVPSLVPLDRILDGVLANVGTALTESGGAVTRDPLPVVFGDSGQLTEVFQNLIGNSLKYRKEDRSLRIHVSCRQGRGEWIISVTDNGVGFDQRHAEEIFGMFKRLRRTETAGSGIGLAVVKKIVERHGGRIWAESRPGEGARFTFTLSDSQSR